MATSQTTKRKLLQLKVGYAPDTSPAGSDYGSDFDLEEEALIEDIFAQLSDPVGSGDTALKLITRHTPGDADPPTPEQIQNTAPPSAFTLQLEHTPIAKSSTCKSGCPSVETEYASVSRNLWSVPDQRSNTQSPKSLQRPQDQDEARSPLERFRVKPKKPLSVTDLVSPAWCELQYWYTLTRFGRKPQTEAMRQGSKVHKTLEEQVHSFIPVRVESKEDAFALRIWNTIQGLRTLQESGFTRELEIWRTVHGQVVNGVIDEISYACPDPELEEGLEQSKCDEHSHQSEPHRTDALQGSPSGETPQILSMIRTHSTGRVYVTDVKTRGVRSLPIGARLRPTRMQLMLYHKILGSLVEGTVDSHIVLDRYSLQPHQPLSTSLIQEFEELELSADGINHRTHQSAGSERHYTLSLLWDMMVTEFRSSITGISDIMRAEFRLNTTGDVIGNEIFVFDETALESYISDGMAWWKGDRAARGVEIEEAYKCRTCSFADECSWRKIKIEEATERHKMRRATRDRSII